MTPPQSKLKEKTVILLLILFGLAFIFVLILPVFIF